MRRSCVLVVVLLLTAGCAYRKVVQSPVEELVESPVGKATAPGVAPGAPVPSEGLASPGSRLVAAPTWTAVYAAYFGPGTPGHCGRSGCHSDVVRSANATYEWLAGRGYIAGTASPLVSRQNSCLRWFGGNMPPQGKANDDAARDLGAWAAAGAAEN